MSLSVCVRVCMRHSLYECQYACLSVRRCSRGTCGIIAGSETKRWGEQNDERNKQTKTWQCREEKKLSAKMTEVEKRRREERGSCRVWGCGWWDVSLEHERTDILMESIIHAKWVTGWVSYFHATRHKVPSISLLTVSGSVFSFCLV